MQHNATKLNQSDWLKAKKNEKQLDLIIQPVQLQTLISPKKKTQNQKTN